MLSFLGRLAQKTFSQGHGTMEIGGHVQESTCGDEPGMVVGEAPRHSQEEFIDGENRQQVEGICYLQGQGQAQEVTYSVVGPRAAFEEGKKDEARNEEMYEGQHQGDGVPLAQAREEHRQFSDEAGDAGRRIKDVVQAATAQNELVKSNESRGDCGICCHVSSLPWLYKSKSRVAAALYFSSERALMRPVTEGHH